MLLSAMYDIASKQSALTILLADICPTDIISCMLLKVFIDSPPAKVADGQ